MVSIQLCYPELTCVRNVPESNNRDIIVEIIEVVGGMQPHVAGLHPRAAAEEARGAEDQREESGAGAAVPPAVRRRHGARVAQHGRTAHGGLACC